MKNKINVNISPNPLDLQTLHCSQNDTEERKFYFTLHNNGEVIDTTDISNPIFEPFSVYKGGTEQLLPVNTDDPTTSPIIADIQYPDEEKTEQEFTYRESPTTLDGNAIIEKLYGNTLVWNQLIQNGNFADGVNNWVESGTTISASDGVLSVVPTGTSGTRFVYQSTNLLNGHKILYSVYLKLNKASTNSRLQFYNTQTSAILRTNNFSLAANVESFVTGIITMTSDFDRFDIQPIYSGQALTTDVFTVRNCMLIDLTAMFGSTKADEIYAMEQSQSGSGVAYFRSLFPLNYYSYGQKLLPFKGTGVKVTGKNLVFKTIEKCNIDGTGTLVADGQSLYDMQVAYVRSGISYFIGNNRTDAAIVGYFTSDPVLGSVTFSGERILGHPIYFTSNFTGYIAFRTERPFDKATLHIGSSPMEYEPYTTSTTTIPTDTYFPTGMKRAGNVFDELTNSKAITRVGEKTYNGGITSMESQNKLFILGNVDDIVIYGAGDVGNLVANGYTANSLNSARLTDDNYIASYNKTFYLRIKGVTTVADANTYLSTNPVTINYELADEEVTQFTQASLICEDGESTLYQDVDSLVCDCTEDFSKDSGFKDCKIKFTNDDGVVYSNKIQLHIERKP